MSRYFARLHLGLLLLQALLRIQVVRWQLTLLSALVLVSLTACASSPLIGEAKTQSDALLSQQFVAASQTVGTQAPQGRILYAGFAMHAESKAFRSDVLTVEKAVRAIDPNAVVFKLDNPVAGTPADWPFATFENIDRVIKRLNILASPKDKVVILISTHGNVNQLGININQQNYSPVTPVMLNASLAALRNQPTLLLLSACHSGSFIKPLTQPQRIIMTAAAADRVSFGCNFKSTNTYFIDAMFNQPGLLDKSLNMLMGNSLDIIKKREQQMNLKPPSNPQMNVGVDSASWASLLLKDWVKP